jgi:hypothetical protein
MKRESIGMLLLGVIFATIPATVGNLANQGRLDRLEESAVRSCSRCKGRGKVELEHWDYGCHRKVVDFETCWVCEGSGLWVPRGDAVREKREKIDGVIIAAPSIAAPSIAEHATIAWTGSQK